MRNSSTSNAASWRTTVSNIAFINWESIRWPSASTTSETGASGRATASSPRQLACTARCSVSMRHPIEHDVHADSVAVRRELVEILLALALALPCIRDVGVVRHHHHQAPFLVRDAAEVDVGAVRSAFRGAAGLHP